MKLLVRAPIDQPILFCYGLQDLDAAHGFYENERGQTGLTVSSEARRELLRTLVELNSRLAVEARP